jgi:predicted RNA-binding Zn-ribbon protein involved in translation (DUF1610 family)
LCKTQEVNIARILYDAYPDSDLLPLDPDQDCRDLQALLGKVRSSNIGDTLFQFLVLEIVEGSEGTLDGAVRVIERARDDVDAVLQALIRARSGRTDEHRKDGKHHLRPARADSRRWRCPDCGRVLWCSYEQIVESGSPYCPACGREMELA